METILFLCGHNAGRSQMAEAYFNAVNKNPALKAISAGTHPSNQIHPYVKEILKKEGIDTSHLSPKLVTEEMVDNAYGIYTMGCGVECHKLPFLINITGDFDLDDPAGQDKKTTQKIFDQLKQKMMPILISLDYI